MSGKTTSEDAEMVREGVIEELVKSLDWEDEPDSEDSRPSTDGRSPGRSADD